ncbi:hypothetical protein SELMODRAFT_84824 [Selaginella moellendorffii]|uniref:histidine kinase n=1 Tax=Selaginella moellendorffii TaxID=88036 RepID=D8R4B8_SELML|nr:hypothetical protein SELMODRAFT_84824 [Selaginella moellendorffii]
MLFFALRELRQTDLTESNGWSHRRHTVLAKWQLGSDFLIAVAYFSIPLELVYFLIKSQVLPFRWVIALFGLFIVLCGITHLLTLWNFYVNSEAAHIGMTIAKVVTATVSCLTAVLLIWVIPELLDVKKREENWADLNLQTAELDVEVGNIKKDQQVLKHVRMLTDEIRSSLDRHKILSTTMIELSHTLELESCNIWMPRASANVLELAHKLGAQDTFAPPEIPLSTSLVDLVFSNNGAVVVPSKALGPLAGAGQTSFNHGSVVAIRIPLLASSGCVSHPDKECYALMVLSFPKNLQKAWGDHELELVEAVADQVAVALSHAAVVEETLKVQDQLIEQNLALQKAKKEAESAVLARNEFLVVMNHEMRTPMHAIIALSSLLLDSGLTSDQQSMVETISKSGSLLSTLINDVLDFSRLEAGSLMLDIQPFKVAKLLDDAERLVSPLAVAKHLPFALKRMGFLPDTVMGDSTRILQVLLNVVGNAIKFTAQGHVHLTVFASKAPDAQVSHEPASPGRCMTQRYIHFEVEDTGIGIRATDLPRLFNKFVQADSSTSRKYGGSGLGLAISKKFVELMNGSISITSEGLDKGSTCRFYVRVSVVSEMEQVHMILSPKAPGDNFHSLKILAVDDNAVNRTVIRRLLNNLGCKSTVVESGETCLKTLAAEGPSAYSIVLVDLCMPEMDGYELTAEIQKLYPREGLHIVALTANTDDSTREKCLSLGMKAVLTKPVSLKALRNELKRIL